VTVLTPPRHPLIDRALADARRWCAGQVIDDRPALTHAARVAVTLGEHVAHPAPELIAAALLHDSPEFAPAGIDLDAALGHRYGREVVRIVRALEAEHHGPGYRQPDHHRRGPANAAGQHRRQDRGTGVAVPPRGQNR
jgi:(p)ppGpp synthase/HD superfamily hydrolase